MVLIKKLVERNESEQLTVDLWSYKVDLYLTIRCMFRIEYNFEIFVHFHGVVPFLKKTYKIVIYRRPMYQSSSYRLLRIHFRKYEIDEQLWIYNNFDINILDLNK